MQLQTEAECTVDDVPQAFAEVRWRLNPDIRMRAFDGNDAGAWVAEIDDAHGRTQRTLLTAPVREALRWFEGGAGWSEVRRQLEVDGANPDRLRRIGAVLASDCSTRRLLVPATATSADALRAHEQPRRPAYLSLMWQILSPRWVNRLAPGLSPLFSRAGLWLGCMTIIAGCISLVAGLANFRRFSLPDSWEALGGVAVALTVVLLHEMGHAAAAWRFGARKVSVGIGWYVLFPVAYADLSETWLFRRRQRMLVDLAGVYVQAQAMAVLMLLYHLHGHPLWLATATAATLSILWNLNPLLRMDGYWLLSDWLGSTHLRTDARAALVRTWRRWRGKAVANATFGRATAWLCVYAVASVVFFGVVIWLALRHFGHGLVQVVPAYLESLWRRDWALLSIADVIVLVSSAAWQLLLLCLLGWMLLRMARRALAWTRSVWNRERASRAREHP